MTSQSGINEKIVALVRSIVTCLVERRYGDVERYTNGKSITANEMQAAIDEYGAVLSMVPNDVLASLDMVRVSAAARSEWSIYCPLWDEDGAIDLTLELTVYENERGHLAAEIDGIHTL